MASSGDATLPATRRSRKSISGASPRKGADQENATIDIGRGAAAAASKRKSRAKSMGPGGLDALKDGTGNRRASLAAPSRPPPRSILKPTIPILPEIPPHKPKKSKSNSPNDPGTKVALRTEEEQQAAAREREEQERAALEKDIKDRREARRKSLANRRVSFAAEATLHTFHDIEYMQDSTTSTDSTRRASTLAASSPAPNALEDPARPTTSSEQVDDLEGGSPDNQRELHQKKRRRSSGASELDLTNSADTTISSTVYDSDSDNGDGVEEEHEEEEEASDSDNDTDMGDGTVATMDGEEMTSASMASTRMQDDSTNSIDEMLRQATQSARSHADDARRNQAIDNGEEVIPSFGWIKKPAQSSQSASRPQVAQSPADNDDDTAGMDMDMDMEMTHAVGGIIRPSEASPDREEVDQEMDMSMDVTKVMGGILSRPDAQDDEEDVPMEEQTMEFTKAIGGIQSTRESDSFDQADEDMSMELTTVLGGVMGGAKQKQAMNRRRSVRPRVQDEDAMDMTMGMDMTTSLGGIIKSTSPEKTRAAAKKALEEEVNQPDAPSTTISMEIKSPLKAMAASVTKDAESPGLAAFRGKGLRRSMPGQTSRTPSPAKQATPRARSSSPAKESSPLRTHSRSVSPPKRQASPVHKPTTPRSSPLKSSPVKSPMKSKNVFEQDPSTGASAPRVLLTPQRRRLSGVGADREGLGSPRIVEIFNRRTSISEAASEIKPDPPQQGRRIVSFEDPRVMEEEVDKEREEEQDKENNRRILEREADGQDDKDATLNLKEMIQGLSPIKNPLRGRKSLHVGSAAGLLGKHPAELDEDEEMEERDGVKRLKNLQASPVKVKLHQPPSKAETTGGRAAVPRQGADDDTTTPTTMSSPMKNLNIATTPKGQGRFKDVQVDEPTNTFNLIEPPIVNEAALQPDDNEDRIHLQDFLNMTSIRFMELTTTKRRHTVAPSTIKDDSTEEDKDDVTLEKCVVAGACTIPMLEMYQPACRELKKYIAAGRKIVREIEADAFLVNPPLFREYITAAPGIKGQMDIQFKNVKANARLLSKSEWYEWRTGLQKGLREGLLKSAEGLLGDEKALQKQQQLLKSVLPGLVGHLEALERECADLDEAARELADCDPAELEAARTELLAADADLEAKKREIETLRAELEEAQTGVDELKGKKEGCLGDIKESEKIREECRGWSSTEVAALKAKVDAIEKSHGWAITGVQGTVVSMTYLRDIELVFHPSSFQPNAKGQANSTPIDLWYLGASRERNSVPASPEREFFLQAIRDHVRALQPGSVTAADLIAIVSASWDRARALAEQVRLLNLTFQTRVERTSDTSIAVRSAAVLPAPLRTKVEVVVDLKVCEGGNDSDDGVHVSVTPRAEVVYGESFNAPKMGEFLASRMGTRVVELGKAQSQGKGAEIWGDVVEDLKARLIARGKKS